MGSSGRFWTCLGARRLSISHGLIRAAGCLVTVLALVAGPPCRSHAGMPAAGLVETDVATGLTFPTAIAVLPDGRVLVAQQNGDLLLASGGTTTLLATIPVCFDGIPADFETETGLLGIAVHPDFPADRSIYLYRTRTPGSDACDVDQLYFGNAVNEVIRVTLEATDTVDLGSLEVLLDEIRAETGYHNGGGLRIGPDRKLYVSVGDGYTGDTSGPPGTSMNPYAQDPSALEGKILRLELDGTPAAGNPFAGGGGRPEVFALGFRNPFRFGFDPVTGALWAGDVGEQTREEIDVVVAGGNYGWPRCEGSLPPGCMQAGDVAPVFEYPQEGPDALGSTVTGGAFPQGGALAGWDDRYVFGDFLAGDSPGALYSAPLDAARTQFAGAPEIFVGEAGGPVDIVVGPDGAIYYAAFIAGAVRRVASDGTSPPPPPPPGGGGACQTIAACQTALDAILPAPAAAPDKKSRRVSTKLGKLDRNADKQLAKAADATGKKQAKRYGKAAKLLGQMVSTAQKAEAKGRLDAPLAAIEAAVAALVALLPGV